MILFILQKLILIEWNDYAPTPVFESKDWFQALSSSTHTTASNSIKII